MPASSEQSPPLLPITNDMASKKEGKKKVLVVGAGAAGMQPQHSHNDSLTSNASTRNHDTVDHKSTAPIASSS